jgi:hypothetical protein
MEYKIAKGNAEVVVSSLGGTILSFKVNGKDILYPYTVDENGKARGGCPVCAPWFGSFPKFGKKKHGFIRDTEATEFMYESEDTLVLKFHHEGTEEYPWTIDYVLTVSLRHDILEVLLTMMRDDDGLFSSAPVNPAFHPYFSADSSVSSVTDGRLVYASCFSKDADAIEVANPSILIHAGGNHILMGLSGNFDAKSRVVFWSDDPDKYVCVEPVLTDKSLFGTSEERRLHIGAPQIFLYMSLAVL